MSKSKDTLKEFGFQPLPKELLQTQRFLGSYAMVKFYTRMAELLKPVFAFVEAGEVDKGQALLGDCRDQLLEFLSDDMEFVNYAPASAVKEINSELRDMRRLNLAEVADMYAFATGCSKMVATMQKLMELLGEVKVEEAKEFYTNTHQLVLDSATDDPIFLEKASVETVGEFREFVYGISSALDQLVCAPKEDDKEEKITLPDGTVVVRSREKDHKGGVHIEAEKLKLEKVDIPVVSINCRIEFNDARAMAFLERETKISGWKQIDAFNLGQLRCWTFNSGTESRMVVYSAMDDIDATGNCTGFVYPFVGPDEIKKVLELANQASGLTHGGEYGHLYFNPLKKTADYVLANTDDIPGATAVMLAYPCRVHQAGFLIKDIPSPEQGWCFVGTYGMVKADSTLEVKSQFEPGPLGYFDEQIDAMKVNPITVVFTPTPSEDKTLTKQAAFKFSHMTARSNAEEILMFKIGVGLLQPDGKVSPELNDGLKANLKALFHDLSVDIYGEGNTVLFGIHNIELEPYWEMVLDRLVRSGAKPVDDDSGKTYAAWNSSI